MLCIKNQWIFEFKKDLFKWNFFFNFYKMLFNSIVVAGRKISNQRERKANV